MDRSLNRAKGHNRRRSERNFSAWVRFSPDGETCRYCKHSHREHLVSAAQPHFYRPATDEERADPRVTLYRHTLADGGYVLVRRMTVANHAEVIAAFCLACAESFQTRQVLCYQRTRAVGEVVGIRRETTAVAA